MKKISMLTIIPHNKAVELLKQNCLKDFNTMPQIDQRVRTAIRDFMSENVGYENLPIACFGRPDTARRVTADELMHVLSTNRQDDIIFQLDMPTDMVVSIDFNKLMEASNEVQNAVDAMDEESILDDFKDSLQLGSNPSSTSIIFIPFLDLDRCRFYAKINGDLDANDDLPFTSIEKMDVRKITSFLEN